MSEERGPTWKEDKGTGAAYMCHRRIKGEVPDYPKGPVGDRARVPSLDGLGAEVGVEGLLRADVHYDLDRRPLLDRAAEGHGGRVCKRPGPAVAVGKPRVSVITGCVLCGDGLERGCVVFSSNGRAGSYNWGGIG